MNAKIKTWTGNAGVVGLAWCALIVAGNALTHGSLPQAVAYGVVGLVLAGLVRNLKN